MSETPSTPPSTESTGARPAFRPSSSRPGGPGARPGSGPRGAGGPPMGRGGRRPPPRRKVCRFCAEHMDEVDYKAVPILRGFLTARGKILSGRTTGNCAWHQRQLTQAIKRAQTLALLPYVGE